MDNQDILAAWAAALEALPAGWALSVTHVPHVDEWGCTASPTVAPYEPRLLSETCRNEADALRSITAILRSQS